MLSCLFIAFMVQLCSVALATPLQDMGKLEVIPGLKVDHASHTRHAADAPEKKEALGRAEAVPGVCYYPVSEGFFLPCYERSCHTPLVQNWS